MFGLLLFVNGHVLTALRCYEWTQCWREMAIGGIGVTWFRHYGRTGRFYDIGGQEGAHTGRVAFNVIDVTSRQRRRFTPGATFTMVMKAIIAMNNDWERYGII